MKVGSLFAGVGGFDLAFERCGMETAWMVENDKQCQMVLRKRFPNAEVLGDIREVGSVQSGARPGPTREPEAGTNQPGNNGQRVQGPNGGDENGKPKRTPTLAPVSVICGGFPCQDYSVAGKRGGLVGDRGALWWEMHRIIADIRPTWVVGENVPGLLSSNGGADFQAIIHSLVQLGYGVTWAVLDSQFFGVAQRRRRLFIVGHSGGEPRPEILALSEGLFGHPAPSREAGQEVAGSLGGRAGNEGGARGDLDNHGAYPLAFRGGAQQDEFVGKDGIVGTLAHSSNHHQGHHQPKTMQGTIPRRLTPTECERLQGFPDGWTGGLKDGPRYRMMGNAVTVNVVEWIGRRIMEAETKE